MKITIRPKRPSRNHERKRGRKQKMRRINWAPWKSLRVPSHFFFFFFSLLLAWSFQLKLSILIITRFWQKNVGAVRNRISMIISVVKPRSGKLLSLWLLQPLGLVPLKMRDGLTHLIVGLICNLLPLSVQDAYNSHFNLISLNDRRFDPKYRSFI